MRSSFIAIRRRRLPRCAVATGILPRRSMPRPAVGKAAASISAPKCRRRQNYTLRYQASTQGEEIRTQGLAIGHDRNHHLRLDANHADDQPLDEALADHRASMPRAT